jgi:phosphatidate cytidylyltransferase
MAYFGGRVIGGPKLVPRISPAKTWAGLLSGVVCGALIGIVVLAPLAEVAVVPIGLLGFAVAAVAQAGDLLESAIKRHFGVKDTSHLIPGHGGIMDRLDGFLAGASFAALFGLLRAGSAAAAAHGLFYW